MFELFFTTSMYHFCNQEKKDEKNSSSLPHIPLMVQPTVICLSPCHPAEALLANLPIIPAKSNSISSVLILTHETPHLASKIPLGIRGPTLFLLSLCGEQNNSPSEMSAS